MYVCPSCGAENIDTNRFCGACGVSLERDGALRREIDASVERALAARIKDRDVVEIQLTNKVLEKLIGWAKTYGTFLAVLIALAAFILARLGIDSYETLKKEVDQTASTVEPKLVKVRAIADKAEKETKDLEARLAQRRAQLDALQTVEARLSALEKVTFEKTPGVSDNVTIFLQRSLDGFARYLSSLGFAPEKRLTVTVNTDDQSNNAYFDPSRSQIVVGTKVANDPDVIYREYTDYALGVGNVHSEPARAVESGLADYYPCSYRGDPNFAPIAAQVLGRPAGMPVRRMDNQRRFPKPDQPLEVHDLGEIWSGAFWELRTRLGQPVADRLLLRAWQRTAAEADVVQFVAALIAADRAEFGGIHVAMIREVFAGRGVKLS